MLLLTLTFLMVSHWVLVVLLYEFLERCFLGKTLELLPQASKIFDDLFKTCKILGKILRDTFFIT
jgi:hypothetical protein